MTSHPPQGQRPGPPADHAVSYLASLADPAMRKRLAAELAGTVGTSAVKIQTPGSAKTRASSKSMSDTGPEPGQTNPKNLSER
jgi:hypothetical protein